MQIHQYLQTLLDQHTVAQAHTLNLFFPWFSLFQIENKELGSVKYWKLYVTWLEVLKLIWSQDFFILLKITEDLKKL